MNTRQAMPTNTADMVGPPQRNTMPDPKPCPKCKKLLIPLVPQTNPEAAELYCATCHQSYLLNGKESMKDLNPGIKNDIAESY